MSSGERPIGAAKGKQSDTEALCQTPPPPSYSLSLWAHTLCLSRVCLECCLRHVCVPGSTSSELENKGPLMSDFGVHCLNLQLCLFLFVFLSIKFFQFRSHPLPTQPLWPPPPPPMVTISISVVMSTLQISLS